MGHFNILPLFSQSMQVDIWLQSLYSTFGVASLHITHSCSFMDFRTCSGRRGGCLCKLKFGNAYKVINKYTLKGACMVKFSLSKYLTSCSVLLLRVHKRYIFFL